MSSSIIPPNMEGLATLLVLQDQVKNLHNIKEFGFFTTNETHRLLHFDIAYLWQKWELFDVQLLAQSEVAEVDQQTPVNQWMKIAIKTMLKMPNVRETQTLDFMDESQQKLLQDQKVLNTWPEVIPKYVLWSPFSDSHDEITGGLILFREQTFTDQEVRMYRWLARDYQYTWKFYTRSKFISLHNIVRRKKIAVILAIATLGILMLPIRLSVISSAIVIPKYPALINAPIQGMIDKFFVGPGEQVKAGQLLISLDKKDFLSTVEINQKKVLLAQAKLRSANDQGYNKADIRTEIPILEAELGVDKADLDYSKSLLGKTDIYSPIDGVAVFESKEDWAGQPVQPGENIMTIADPEQVELKIVLPVSDLINLEVGSEGKFYAYGQLSEIPVQLTSIGYNAEMTPSKTLAYRFVAQFTNPGEQPRLGSQGNVQLYGHYVPLIYYILRKPLHTIRLTLGL